MILPLHAANPSPMTGAGNWTYFLPGRHPVLIDAGIGGAAHLDAIGHARAEGPAHVLVTHAHGDHINGVRPIAERWPATRFSKCSWPERDARHAVTFAPLADGELIPAGDGALQAIHTPGHAPDHVAFWDESTRTLFSGDLVVRGTTVVILASAGGNLREYLRSLERALALAPRRLLPAHGEPIDDPKRLLQHYLDHRREREAQIRAALDAGLRSIDAMVERIYVGLQDALRPMARESVLAHLVKLEEEGSVRREGDEWTVY